jgi:MOSC domain-containing protein YiiM
MSGAVVSLQIVPGNHAPVRYLDEVRAIPEEGLEGDWHRGHGRRSVLLMHSGDVQDLGIRPGDLREQITVDLPGLMKLAPGTRLRVGPAVLEITKECVGCTHIGEHVGVEDVEAFRVSLEGRRGMLATVLDVQDGEPIRVGDQVEVLG